MLFNSYQFLLAFLPITLLGFFWLGKLSDRRFALGWLTACSIAFYAWWSVAYAVLLGGSITGNFVLGRALEAMSAREGDKASWARWWVTALGITANLLLLGYFKYANFLVDTVAAATGAEWTLAPIVLPLAISFHTFQQIAYLVDRYQGGRNRYAYLDYLLFVTFFPQLIAGPIVHHKSLLPQLHNPRMLRLQADDFAIGVTIFVIGLFKKVVLADHVADYANPTFALAAQGQTLTFLEAWLAAFAYTFQLYFDFSGYSDMAIGLARLFSVRLPLNFNSPYKATSIIDFWRRWHITLSKFLRDYLYIPLGGSRNGPVRRYANLLLTMLLGGLWHGAGWTYIFWGAFHGACLCVNHGWLALCKRQGWEAVRRHPAWRVTAGVITMLAVVVGWVFFRATSFSAASTMLAAMAGFHGFELTTSFNRSDALQMLIPLALIAFFAPNTQQLMARFEPADEWETARLETPELSGVWAWLVWRPSTASAVVVMGLAVVAALNMTRVAEFLYFQF